MTLLASMQALSGAHRESGPPRAAATKNPAAYAQTLSGAHRVSSPPNAASLTATARSCISLLVSVPVLSLKTYSTRPRSSTMSLLRARACSPALPSRSAGSIAMKTEHCAPPQPVLLTEECA